MARGGGSGASGLTESGPETFPEWAQEAVARAEQTGRDLHAARIDADLTEQKRLYGRVLHQPAQVDACELAAVGMQDLIDEAVRQDRMEEVQQLHDSWRMRYQLTDGREEDEGVWLIAQDLQRVTQSPLLMNVLALQRTRPLARTDGAHRLERRWLRQLGSESIWLLLARAWLTTDGQLPESGTVHLKQLCELDRIRLAELHDSYRLWVEDGCLNARHASGKAEMVELAFEAGELVDILPGGLAAPTMVEGQPEGSSFYVARATRLFDAGTIVQLHGQA